MAPLEKVNETAGTAVFLLGLATLMTVATLAIDMLITFVR